MSSAEPALILKTAPAGESFVTLHALSAERGLFYCLKRVSSGKKKSATSADLFDTAELELQAARSGNQTLFVNQYRIQRRRTNIGTSYACLLHASNYSSLLTRNAIHMPDPRALFDQAERTFNAFDTNKSPQIVFFKGLYLLLQTEGFPVREDWWPNLASEKRCQAHRLLREPVHESPSPESLDNCRILTDDLCHWLQRETDFILPWIK